VGIEKSVRREEISYREDALGEGVGDAHGERFGEEQHGGEGGQGLPAWGRGGVPGVPYPSERRGASDGGVTRRRADGP